MESAGEMNLGACLEFGWTTFKRQAAAYVVTSLVLLVVYVAAQSLIARLRTGGLALGLLLGPLYWVCMLSVARQGATGAAPTLTDAFRPFTERQGDYLMVALAMACGAILCGIGILVSWFVCFFAPLLALDGRDFKAAVIESKDLVFKYPAEVALLAVTAGALNLAGALACGLGLIISTPVVSLMIVKAYEQLRARNALPAPQQQV